MPMSKEVYVSTDVETDGPIPGPHSMVSFASAAYQADKTLLSTFSANLETLPDATGYSATMARWKENAKGWGRCGPDLAPPGAGMARSLAWVKSLRSKPVFVAYPAGFDFLFVYWY